MAKVVFVTRISKMGNRLMIGIPADYLDEIKKLKAKQIKVILDDEI